MGENAPWPGRRDGCLTYPDSQVNMLDFFDIRAFCLSREVDLVLAPAPAPFTLCLHGEFDGLGDFFSMLAKDVEFVELAGGFTAGDLQMTRNVGTLSSLSPKWSQLSTTYSGLAIAFRTADGQSWGVDRETFVLIANHVEWHAGRDWRDGHPTA